MIDSSIVNNILDIFRWLFVTLGGYVFWRVYRLERRVAQLENNLFKTRIRSVLSRRTLFRLKRAYVSLHDLSKGIVAVMRSGGNITREQMGRLERVPTVKEVMKS